MNKLPDNSELKGGSAPCKQRQNRPSRAVLLGAATFWGPLVVAPAQAPRNWYDGDRDAQAGALISHEALRRYQNKE